MTSHMYRKMQLRSFLFVQSFFFCFCELIVETKINPTPSNYVQIAKMDLPWLNGTRVAFCGYDTNTDCNMTYLSMKCDQFVRCNGFNSNGYLKFCTGGRCTCELSSNSCPEQSNNTDLYIKKQGINPPNDWQNAILNGSILFDSLINNTLFNTSLCYQPEIGNGYLGTNINWDAMYITGLFNGKCGNVHKARLPSTLLVHVTNGVQIANGLDLKNAMFLKRWSFELKNTNGTSGTSVIIEQRFFAHRKRKHLLIMQFEIVDYSSNKNDYDDFDDYNYDFEIQIYLNDSFDVDKYNSGSNINTLAGNNCAGSFTTDLKLTIIENGSNIDSDNYNYNYNYNDMDIFKLKLSNLSPMIINGETLIADDNGNTVNISIVKDKIPPYIWFNYSSKNNITSNSSNSNGNQIHTFITSIATSIDIDDNSLNSSQSTMIRALTAYKDAINIDNYSTVLINEHKREWDILYNSGIDIWERENHTSSSSSVNYTNEDIIALNGMGLNFNTINNILRHIHSSIYYIYSSIREDWPVGVSPGGISTQNYNGAIFFDMDWYINPPLMFLNINLSKSLINYRFNSINASLKIAKIFGYNGTQFAWTAAYKGNPFGCCDGTGGYEDCLEQHITGDIGVMVWNYYLITKNNTWLNYIGWPILNNIANWIVSRVTPTVRAIATSIKNIKNTNDNGVIYNINNVLPVDEWCVGAGCGCETPGVNNDVYVVTYSILYIIYNYYMFFRCFLLCTWYALIKIKWSFVFLFGFQLIQTDKPMQSINYR